MEEQENNSHLEDFLEVLQDQHREIKNIGVALERISVADNPLSGKIDKLMTDIAAIKAAQQQATKDKETANDPGRMLGKIEMILEIARAEQSHYATERKADILIKVKSRKLIIWSSVCLFIGILGIIIGICYWRKNRGLIHHDLKYRYYRMSGASPQLIDSLYQISPDRFRDKVLKLEQQKKSDTVHDGGIIKSETDPPAKEKKRRVIKKQGAKK